MRLLGHNSLRASLLAIILLVLVTALGVAQNTAPSAPVPQSAVNAAVQTPKPAQPFPDYSKSKGPWYNLLAPYSARHVQSPSYANSPRIDAVFKDGTMYLSLQDAVALAIENNLDVAVQRYNIPIADTDILRTKAGQIFHGVAAGVVQGTPGGASGFAASGSIVGTQIGVGGAGAGAAGQVLSTLGLGPFPYSFDPTITGNIYGERAQTPEATPLFVGAPTLGQNSTIANFTYNQGFATGTQIGARIPKQSHHQ